METKILVPLDGSPLAEAVLPHAQLLARATHSSLILFRASAPPLMTEPMVNSLPAPVLVHETQKQDSELAQSYLDEMAKELEDQGFAVRTDLREGDPALAIITFALHEPNLLMIAMATHGRSGLQRWLFGSVAEKVRQAAPVPLLLVRPTAETPTVPAQGYKTILVPLDGSIFAEQALDEACDLAQATGAALVLMSAVGGVEDTAAGVVGEIPLWESEHHEAEVQRMTAYLKQTATRLLNAGIPAETQVGHGRPAEAILRAAGQEGADLIVMATHGRGGLQRLWLGSVAARVVQAATLPVLLVRAKEESEKIPEAEEAVALAR